MRKESIMAIATLPTLYIPHGGGPCFFMEWTMGPADMWHKMGAWLSQLGSAIDSQPRAIVVVSAHWESAEFALTAAAQPPLLYDYYGFPEHTYQLQYGAPGAPELAQSIAELLREAALPVRLDAQRGFDHGVFIPFKLIYPEANIPIVQLSLQTGLDPAVHIAVGRALQPLRDQGVLIVGSGMSYHNMRGVGAGVGGASDQFDAWLTAAVSARAATRNEQLCQWQQAPAARIAHPREEHLLPLMVVAGAAGTDLGRKIFEDRLMGSMVSAYQFG
jgi:aromatic ring-opening dioxygenase catalytic subunit (LigB family)